MERLCELISVPSSYMPSSIKLMCVHFMNSLLNYPQFMEKFLGWDAESCDGHVIEEKETPYRRMLEVLLSNQVRHLVNLV